MSPARDVILRDGCENINIYIIIYIFCSRSCAGYVVNTAKGVIHMKIICSKSNLLNGVNTVSKAVPSKTTMSILECILIDATKGCLLYTSDAADE